MFTSLKYGVKFSTPNYHAKGNSKMTHLPYAGTLTLIEFGMLMETVSRTPAAKITGSDGFIEIISPSGETVLEITPPICADKFTAYGNHFLTHNARLMARAHNEIMEIINNGEI